jgi:hypothetical protein
MSDSPPPIHGPTRSRSGLLTAVMMIAGIVMLLPGLCAVLIAVIGFAPPHDPIFALFILLGMLVGFFGILLIRAALRG